MEVTHAELSQAFEEQGIAFPIPVLSPSETSRGRDGFEELEARLGGKTQNLSWVHFHFEWARSLVSHPAVLDAVEAVLGPNLLVLSTLILCKHPNDPGYVGWHQDGTYWQMHSTPTASAWIALTDSMPANGCMRVIPGSHRDKMLPHVETYARDSLLGRGEQVDVEVDDNLAIDVALRAGEMSIHQNSILHGSQPNRSDIKRIGFITRFVTPAFEHARSSSVAWRTAPRRSLIVDSSHLESEEELLHASSVKLPPRPVFEARGHESARMLVTTEVARLEPKHRIARRQSPHLRHDP